MPATGQASFPALGSGAVTVVADGRRLEAAHQAVAAEVDAIDRACSRFRADSELTRVNAAGGRPVAVGEVLLDAVEVALRAARLTGGDVDPTVGQALMLLGYDRDFDAVAAAGRPVVRAAVVPGWRRVRVDRRRGRVRVPAGVRLDLGATAKALAADRAAARAARAAGCGVLVSLGGDVAAAGEPPPGGWQVRVADWHAAGPDAQGETVSIAGGGLATSSTTVRRWTRGEEHLHHIVDPRTGRSAPVVWRTVSVAAATCVDANVAATAAIIRGVRAAAWLGGLGLPARLVRPDGSVVRVAGWPEPGRVVAA
ncbi:MAG TPA: FAD:protein FMN transferase [Actinomycetes bacterium]|nr:FAD:protein FMN transferase [Actinomycetes bacterium]